MRKCSFQSLQYCHQQILTFGNEVGTMRVWPIGVCLPYPNKQAISICQFDEHENSLWSNSLHFRCTVSTMGIRYVGRMNEVEESIILPHLTNFELRIAEPTKSTEISWSSCINKWCRWSEPTDTGVHLSHDATSTQYDESPIYPFIRKMSMEARLGICNCNSLPFPNVVNSFWHE